jgi:predicted phosphodiesterase
MKPKHAGYKQQAFDFIERAMANQVEQSITEMARNFCDENEIDYSDSFRRHFSLWMDAFKIKLAERNSVKRELFGLNGFDFNIPDGEDEIEIPEMTLPKRYRKVAVISDIHLPYHDRYALVTALREIKDIGVDAIYINGDLMDAYQLSRHEKNKLNRSFKYEVDMTRLFFEELRKQFTEEDIYFKIGNHDVRFDKYIMDNADQLNGLINLEDVLRLRDHRVKLVGSMTKVILGKLNILHGHELPVKGALNHARAVMSKVSSNVLMGHFHRSDRSYMRDLEGDVHAVFGTGCLCKLNPKYMSINNWNHGWALVEVEKDGSFVVESKDIFI